MADVNTSPEAVEVQHAGRSTQHAAPPPPPDTRIAAALARLNQAICLSHTALSVLRLEFRETPEDLAGAFLRDAARRLADEAHSDLRVVASALGVSLSELPDAYSVDLLLRSLGPAPRFGAEVCS